MASGYAAGIVWFALIKVALWADFSAPEGSSAARWLLAYFLTSNGEGIDPSYTTTLVSLLVVPIVSLMTTMTTPAGARADFYAMLSGEKKVEAELV